MKTINDVTEKLADHLANMDLDKLNMSDLCTYTSIVRSLHDMREYKYMREKLSAGIFHGDACVTTAGN